MITKIKIENAISIRKMLFEFSEDNSNVICLIGKNGAGKSSILRVLKFFFDHMEKTFSEEIIIDSINPYIQKCIVEITFDLSSLILKSEKNNMLSDDISEVLEYSEDGNQVTLAMEQNKDGKIEWSIPSIKVRKTLKSVFPLYLINTRHLDINKWEKLWDIISDLSSTIPEKSKGNCEDILEKAFEDIYGEKYTKSRKIIDSAFFDKKVTLNNYNFQSRYKDVFSIRYGGEQYLYEKRDLNFYSDGTNSYNYLSLLISLISKIASISCKSPILLIDEPEIGLHNSFIQNLVRDIADTNDKDSMMILCTHSPQLIAELSNQKVSYLMYRIEMKRMYSEIHQMNLEWLKESKVRISSKEAECYFVDKIVFVEGETELQLFYNRNLQSLFPTISKVHFYSFDSNNSKLKTINPELLNLGITYKLIVDSDKVIKYNDKSEKFKSANDTLVNPFGNKSIKKGEKLRYYKSSELDIIELRHIIESMLDKTYLYAVEKNYIDNEDFNKLMYSLRTYCNYYNTLVNWTTIEGELITYQNIDTFLEFIKSAYLDDNIQCAVKNIQSKSDYKERTAYTILFCNGRSELQEKKEKESICPSLVGEKTSGWVDDWINYYFDNELSALSNEHDKRKRFAYDFPLLNDTLQNICNVI